MKTTILADRNLTESEQFTIDRFTYYYDEKRAFVVIDEHTVVVIEAPSTHEEMISFAKEAMYKTANSHPDFTSYIMDDGNVLIEMNYNVYSFANGEKEGLTKKDKKVPVSIALHVREYCLEAAAQNKFIAVVEPE